MPGARLLRAEIHDRSLNPDRARDPDLEPDLEPDRNPDLEPDRDPDLEPDRDPDLEPDRDPDLEPDRDPDLEPDRNPDDVFSGGSGKLRGRASGSRRRPLRRRLHVFGQRNDAAKSFDDRRVAAEVPPYRVVEDEHVTPCEVREPTPLRLAEVAVRPHAFSVLSFLRVLCAHAGSQHRR
jgi:hypothetical protein